MSQEKNIGMGVHQATISADADGWLEYLPETQAPTIVLLLR